MLCLSRKIGERIVIRTPEGRQITIFVAAVERGKVRLGVEAERSVEIYREEILPPKPPESKK